MMNKEECVLYVHDCVCVYESLCVRTYGCPCLCVCGLSRFVFMCMRESLAFSCATYIKLLSMLRKTEFSLPVPHLSCLACSLVTTD